jgi:hypothetical protein
MFRVETETFRGSVDSLNKYWSKVEKAPDMAPGTLIRCVSPGNSTVSTCAAKEPKMNFYTKDYAFAE